MSEPRLSLLVVEDERPLAKLWAMELGQRVEATLAHSLHDAREKLAGRAYDAVLLDLHLPDGNGLDLLREVHQRQDDTHVMILTGNADLDSAIHALRLGAYDYMVKPCQIAELEQRLGRIARQRQLSDENAALRQQLRAQRAESLELVGQNPALVEAKRLIGLVASSDSPVLIFGETGTGKEVAARQIHAGGPRARGPFVPVNCAAVPHDLADSELFGHRAGALRGADRDRRGLVQAAAGGTLFLDEVGELPTEIQAKFLRLLESKEGRRVGDSEPYRADVRILAATHRDLRAEAADGRFRQDLFFRLAAFELNLPPLRDIPDDLPHIAQYWLERAAVRNARATRISDAALGAMRYYGWPGNVRELRNVIERAKILCDADEIGPEHLSLPSTPAAAAGAASPASGPPAPMVSLAEMEWRLIQSTMRAFGGNKTAAARTLGISLRTLYNKIQENSPRTPIRKTAARR